MYAEDAPKPQQLIKKAPSDENKNSWESQRIRARSSLAYSLWRRAIHKHKAAEYVRADEDYIMA